MQNEKRFRHELKYLIGHYEYMILRKRLIPNLQLDKNVNERGVYNIRSLYFDDCYNKSLFEKLSGLKEREKFRIRIYNKEDKLIKLERKEKINDLTYKEQVEISRKDYENILKGNIAFLKNSNSNLLKYFYTQIVSRHLKPVVIVDYNREPYMLKFKNIRITFDKELKTGLTSTNIFDKNLVLLNVLESPLIILEIKYDDFLPSHIKNLMQISVSKKVSISKYTICRKHNKLNSWEDN